jgi:hypothetical protein
MGTNRIGPTKDLLHFLGPRIRRDIDVFWRFTPDEIADAATGPVSDVPGGTEALD